VSVLFGLIAAVVCAIVAALVTMALGFRDGDRPGDARVTARRVIDDAATAFAEIVVENAHDSPVLVSARSRRASVFALAAPYAQRTAFTHRRRLDGVELLGAVEGQGIRRYLLPIDGAQAATTVTVVVDQAARRTRITTATLRASASSPLRSASPRDVADA
jgi:hypothetical protein